MFQRYKPLGASMNFHPLNDNILIEKIEAENKTTAGLYIPDSAKERSQLAKVISVGPGRRNDDGSRQEMSVEKGDKIIYRDYSEHKLKLEGIEMMIVKESDILAIVVED
jgi:chaperonin GroES